jgi:hypothetical protein
MVLVNGPVISIIVEGDIDKVKRKMVLFGDYHDKVSKCDNQMAMNMKDFLLTTFDRNVDKQYVFFMEAYPGIDRSIYDKDDTSYMSPLGAYVLAENKRKNVELIACDIRYDLPCYGKLQDAFNFPSDFADESEMRAAIARMLKQTAKELTEVCTLKDDTNPLFLYVLNNPEPSIERGNTKLCAHIALELLNAYKLFVDNKLSMEQVQDAWFSTMLAMNDIYVVNRFLKKPTPNTSIAYMGYLHAVNIAYRLVRDHGMKVTWVSNGASPATINGDLMRINETRHTDLIPMLAIMFNIDQEMIINGSTRQCVDVPDI